MSNVILFPGVTTLPIEAERILEAAKERELEEVIVIGHTKDGAFYFASSVPGGLDTMWLLERARHKLHMIADSLEEEF